MPTILTVQCPSCDADFPVDPAKVPEGGVRTRCTVCGTEFRVDAPDDAWSGEEDAFWTPDEAEGAHESDAAAGVAADGELEVEPAGDEPAGMEMAEAELEIAEALEVEPEPVEPEPAEAAEAAAADAAADAADLDDWVVEREEEGDEAYTAFMADEVMLSADELDVPVGEVEVETPSLEGDETPELPPLEPAAEAEPAPEMAAETVLEDLDEVETVFEPEDAGDVAADEPMGQGYVETEAVEAEAAEAEVVEAEPAEPEAEPAPAAEEEPAPSGFQFGRRDPHDKARRLARVLVSDMITYNPERHARALENDSLKEDFEEEIEKSWAEYVEQVGQDLAESTSYWNEALNEILARGRPLF